MKKKQDIISWIGKPYIVAKLNAVYESLSKRDKLVWELNSLIDKMSNLDPTKRNFAKQIKQLAKQIKQIHIQLK